jgi:hypothetical protein
VHNGDVASLTTSAPRTVRRNKHAGRLLKSWRINQGLSCNQLAWEIAQTQTPSGRKLPTISGRQIHRIETVGIVPTPRLAFALASYFGTTPLEIWTKEMV